MQQITIINKKDGDEVLNDLRIQIKQAMAEKGYSCLKLSVLASTSAETIRRFVYVKGGSMRLDIFARVCLALDLDLTTKPFKKENNALKEAAQAVLDNWQSGHGAISVADLMNDLKQAINSEKK